MRLPVCSPVRTDMRWVWLLSFVVACGSDRHSSGDDASPTEPDASEMDVDASQLPPVDAPSCESGQTWCSNACVDITTDEAHCGDCTTTCDAEASCVAGTCKPGAPHAATGKCTEIDQPGWLSCPTGMACKCYYHYYKTFIDKPASLTTWVTSTSVEIQGGMLPQNSVLTSAPTAMVPLTTNPTTGVKTGSYYPYTVTIGATGALEVKLRDSDGYVPAKFVLQTSADCGNRGQILECTFN
jgi:hypothetical protein